MLLLRLRLRGGGKNLFKCKKCGGERKMYTPCLSPCEFGKGWVEPTKAEQEEERKKWWANRIAKMEAIRDARIKRKRIERRDQRAKNRADARMLAEAKAKKPKIMRELETSLLAKPKRKSYDPRFTKGYW